MRARLLAVAGLVPALALAAAVAPASGDDGGDRGTAMQQRAVRPAVLDATTMRGTTFVAAPHRSTTARRTATFQVTYSGFTQKSRQAFQRAVNTWSTLITSDVPITVQATWAVADNPNNLGSAGPTNIFRNFDGAPKANTWYVDAIANKRAGEDIDPSTPDIVANFNSGFTDWYFGTGQAPSGKYDFQSVVTHELGHGLGFLGLGNGASTQGTIRIQGSPTGYDRAVERGSNTRLTTLADPSAALGNALRGNDLWFDTTKVRNANNGKRARLYAPGAWQAGSSYSHLNENTYPAGNVSSLMTPFLADGETIRNPGALTVAVLTSIGW